MDIKIKKIRREIKAGSITGRSKPADRIIWLHHPMAETAKQQAKNAETRAMTDNSAGKARGRRCNEFTRLPCPDTVFALKHPFLL